MGSKSTAGDNLKIFCGKFGVPESLTFDSSKGQNCKGTEFMQQYRRYDIDHYTIEPDLNEQNHIEGVIHQVRRKWYMVMVRKQVPTRVWDYGLR